MLIHILMHRYMGGMVLVGGTLQVFMVNLILLRDGSHGKNSNIYMEHLRG